MKVELEKVVAAIANGIIPSTRKLMNLEMSKDAGLKARFSTKLKTSFTIHKENGVQFFIHETLPSTVPVEAGVDGGADREQDLEGLQDGEIEVELHFNSDGKQGVFSKLFQLG